MSWGTRWWARATAAGAGFVLALVVPAIAWAGSSPAVLATADEVLRRRPRVGGLGTLCCLVVVAVIVVVVVLAMRRRRPPGR